MAYTPGPWEPQDTAMGLDVVSKERRVAALYDLDMTTNWSNARLISAAPDLLAALKGVVAIADRNTVEFDKARAAIAKATGEVGVL